MSKNRIIFIVGVIVLLLPISGFPLSWKNFFYVILGLLLIYLSLNSSLKRRKEETTGQINEPNS